MNVISNAIDALEEYNSNRTLSEIKSSPSKITISTTLKEKTLAENASLEQPLPKSLPTVVITIADNGLGMSQETMSKIFDPFFTTKLGQGGSGVMCLQFSQLGTGGFQAAAQHARHVLVDHGLDVGRVLQRVAAETQADRGFDRPHLRRAVLLVQQ